MSRCDIEIRFDKSDRTYAAGDVVSGEVLVRVNKDISCNGILLKHYWKTHGKGNTVTGTMGKIQLCESQPLQAGEKFRLPFEFTSELWPLTYHGEYINVDHYVYVAVDVPWAIDPKHAEEFIVLPGQVPLHFTGDRSQVIELKDEKSASVNTSLPVKIIFGLVVLILVTVLVIFIPLLLPFAVIAACMYWVRKKAVSSRIGEVTIKTPVVVVGPGEDWPCELSFTPRKTFSINEVSARLLVEESATSGCGTNSTTHRHTLFDEKEIILPAGQLTAGQPFSEQVRVPLPDTNAWSLNVSDNTIQWTMDVRIDIPRFPDWSHKTTLQMVPGKFLSGGPEVSPQGDSAPVPFEKSADTPDAGPVAEEPAAATLFEVVSAISNANRHGNERTQVISAVADTTFGVAIIVDRVSTTLGISGDTSEEHQQGRTVLGTIAGTDQAVQLFTREHNNAAVDGVARDEVWESQATVTKWDSLYNRLVMLEV